MSSCLTASGVLTPKTDISRTQRYLIFCVPGRKIERIFDVEVKRFRLGFQIQRQICSILKTRSPCALGILKVHRFLRFILQHRCPFLDLTGRDDVNHLHLHEITPAEFSVNLHIEQCKVAIVIG